MKVNRISGKVKNLYYISSLPDLDRKTIRPQVPVSMMTRNKFEDWKTKRICLYPGVDKALTGMNQNLTGMTLYVYSPQGISMESLIKPSITEVPTAWITDEYWYLSSVQLRLVGSVTVKERIEPGLSYRYGPRQTEGKLYKWSWKENLKPWEKERRLVR